MASQFQISEMLVGGCRFLTLFINQEMLVVTDELISHLTECHITDTVRCRDEFCQRVLYLSDATIGGRCPVYSYAILCFFQQNVENLQ